MQKHRLLEQALPSLFPFSLPLPLPFLRLPRRLDRGTYTSFVHSLSVAQPRPQGAFPWLRLQSQGKRPGDEVERSPHCTLLAYKGTVHPETDIRYGEIIQIVCCSNLIYHKSSIKYPPLK